MAFAWTKVQGIVCPLTTPLSSQDVIDKDGTRRLIEHVIDGGVTGIFILGSSGEGPSLSHGLKREFIHLCCEIVAGRVPVLVGVSDTALMEIVRLAKVVLEAGANNGCSVAAVFTSPYYYPCSQSELIGFVQAVLEQVEIPIILYNIPSITKVAFNIATIRELSKHPNIVGVKDSSGDMDYFGELCKLRQEVRPHDWTVMIGPEHLTVKAIEMGADGGINGGSNVEPKLFCALYNEAAAKRQTGNDDDSVLVKLTKRVDAFQEIYQVCGNWVVATKCACSVRNICSGLVAKPLLEYSVHEQDKIEAILEELPSVDECRI